MSIKEKVLGQNIWAVLIYEILGTAFLVFACNFREFRNEAVTQANSQLIVNLLAWSVASCHFNIAITIGEIIT